MTHTIYTAGYAGWTPDALRAAAIERDALVLDIRMSPFSKRPEWRIEPLRDLFGNRYHHLPALGNRNYNTGGPIELADPFFGVGFVKGALADRSVILLCGCYDWRTCHRSVAANLINNYIPAPVVHLDPPVRRKAAPVVTQLPLFGEVER